jgi:hypothetical protein
MRRFGDTYEVTHMNADVPDRRRRRRLNLVCPLRLFRAEETRGVEATTENISSGGFSCITALPFSPGEQLACELVIPRQLVGYDSVVLRCRVEVVRASLHGLSAGYGVACRLLDYTVQMG